MASKAQIATMIGLMVPAIGMPAYLILNSKHTAPNLTTRESLDEKIAPKDNSITCHKSEKFPYTRQVQFRDPETKTLFEYKVLLPLLKDYREELGDRGFTSYEMLQILGKHVDDKDFGLDIGEITRPEVALAIKEYEQKGKKAFDLDLEAPKFKGRQTPEDLMDAHKRWESAAYNTFKEARRVEEIAKAEFQTMKRVADNQYVRQTHYYNHQRR